MVTHAGFAFPFIPIGLNSALLVVLGYVFHKLSRRSYPHKAAVIKEPVYSTASVNSSQRMGFQQSDLNKALENISETFDISTSDLDAVLREAERQALIRSHASLSCEKIMSKNISSIKGDERAISARSWLLTTGARVLPVVDSQNKLVGTIGLRDIRDLDAKVADCMSAAAIAYPETPAIGLLSILTDGKTHSVIVINGEREIAGLISQSDFLNAVAKLIPIAA